MDKPPCKTSVGDALQQTCIIGKVKSRKWEESKNMSRTTKIGFGSTSNRQSYWWNLWAMKKGMKRLLSHLTLMVDTHLSGFGSEKHDQFKKITCHMIFNLKKTWLEMPFHQVLCDKIEHVLCFLAGIPQQAWNWCRQSQKCIVSHHFLWEMWFVGTPEFGSCEGSVMQLTEAPDGFNWISGA